MDDLPDGWVWTTLSEICDINPKRDLGTVSANDQVTFVPMSAIDDVYGTIAKPEVREYQGVRKGYTHFAEGDVLFAKITPCMENGKATIARSLLNGVGCGTTELHVLRPLGGVLPEFIFYYVRQKLFRRDAEANMTGTAGQLRVSASYMRKVRVPLCPIPEQRRIVSKVEELMERNRLARSALSQVPSLIKEFRQSVIAKAFHGELTERDANDEPAEKLLERIRQERRKKWEEELRAKGTAPKRYKYEESLSVDVSELPDIPGTWIWTTLREVFDIEMGQSPPGSSYNRRGDGLPLLNGPTEFGEKYPHPVQWTTKPKKVCARNDILICVRGNTTGRMNFADKPYCIGRGLAAIRPTNEFVDRRLAYYFLVYKTAEIMERTAGSTFPNLPREELGSLPFPLAPYHEQQTLVRRIEAVFADCNICKTAVENALNQAVFLEESVLGRAFRGELAPQDPNDKIASVLLEQIRTQRATVRAPLRGHS